MVSKKGVTLIELIVAMGILAILIVILYSVFSVSLRAWKKADNILKSTTIARVVLDRITREISSAVIEDDKGYCLLGFDSTAPSGWRTDSIGDEIYFFAALNPGEDNKSDLCEVGFWLDGQATALSSDDILRRFYVTDGRKTGTPMTFDFDLETGTNFEFSENITDFQITFFDDNGNPRDRWGSLTTTEGVPSKIEVSITVQVGEGAKATNPEFYQNSYTATIFLPQ